MATLTGTRDYTPEQMIKIRAAFSFLNEDRSAASATQVANWIDGQVEAKVLQSFQRSEGAKADAAAVASLRNL